MGHGRAFCKILVAYAQMLILVLRIPVDVLTS